MRFFGKTAMAVGLAGMIGFAGLVGGMASAGAATPISLAEVGSDTTYWAMRSAAATYNAAQTATVVTEVMPIPAAPFPTSVTVPADSHCAAKTYNTTNLPPNGSSAGITALQNDATGCIDFARSSRGRGSSDISTDQFVAYALDAVTWSYNSTNTHNVHNLTISQLINIYTCSPTTHAPFVSNWSQLGGTAGPIVKYAPQTGSGTLSFFQTKLLNGATVDQNCDSAHLSHRAEENQGQTRCTNNDPTCASGVQAIPSTDYPNLIMPYSYAKWTAQKNAAETDVRHGQTLGAVNGKVPAPTTVNETSTRFVGTRYVYNVLKTTEPSYAQTRAFAGASSTSNGFLCAGKAKGNLTKYGFTPLTAKVQGPGLMVGNCRVEPTPL